ncbi:MAG: hypothetical protein MIO92_04540 [Methanosarcinaceae archaeon]|nr:hypothetical protein [Methanosarcinaceae archaeon]
MRVSIHGLGFVGSVSLAGLAQCGHEIIGVDISQNAIDLIKGAGLPSSRRT